MSVYKKGDIVKGVVTGIKDYGAFIMLEDNYTGLIHISEISEGFVVNIEKFLKKGDEIEAKVVSVDEKNKKLRLTIKYRTDSKLNRSKIEEVGGGFESLRKRIDGWIEEKIQEINEEKAEK